MRRWIMVIIGCVVLSGQVGLFGQDTMRVMFWNLENFFDNRNDSTSVSDAEFSSYGERHWSRKKFNTKCASSGRQGRKGAFRM